jgi:1A family penicillin-binding protein
LPTNRQPPRKAKSSGFALFIAQTVKAIFILGLIAATVAAGYLGASIWMQVKDLPDITAVEKYEPIEAIQLFDRNDRLICTVEGDEDRRVVPLNQVSNHMIQAMLAAEDHHFFEHHGVNFGSIIRAFFANVQAGHVVEGGSTITQQLVKNLFFTEAGRTIDRKVKEAAMAYELERRYSKERILEMYLNQVYFGNNAYGIDRAASRYFDKSAAELNLSQSAFLAGLVKAPSELGVPSNRAMALSRQREILDKMVEYGYITAPQRDKALKTKLVFKKGNNPLQKYPYYVSYVLEILRSKFTQSEMRRQGLKVYTNLEPKAQEIAESVLAEGIKKAPKGVSQGALVSITVSTGAVCAMVGGVGNFWKNQFNRASNPHTVGSSFKPFVYLTAFIKGVASPETMVDDRPITIHQGWGLPDWSPKDFDHKFMGRIPMRKALALSRNVPSVRTAQLVGIDRVVETARLAGITSRLDPNLSLALGSSAVSPLDMASAYSTFARMGVALTPTVLRRIENSRGQVIEVFEPRVDKVFAVEPVAELVSILQDVVKYGTGTQAKLADRPVAGKTGTADAAKDIWFIGFTPDLVTAVWAGNDENLPIPGTHVTGGVVMAKIWRQYNEGYYKAFPTPPGSFIAPTVRTPRNPEKLAGNSNVLTAADSVSKDKVDAATSLESEATSADGLKEQTPTLAPDTQTPSVTLTPSTSETPATSEKQEPAKVPEGTPAPAPEAPTRLVPAPSAHLLPLHGLNDSPASETASPSTEPKPAPAIPETKSMAPRRLYPASEATSPDSPDGTPGRRLYPATGYQSPLPPQQTTVSR